MHSSWIPWILGACTLLILPVLLRLYVGDEPQNEIAHEQGQDGDPAEMRLAA